MPRESGFTLVELMIVTAILAILTSVAIPAYINYINRTRQTDAVTVLMNAKMDQEAFFEGTNVPNNRYASTIGCLPSCNNGNTGCLSNCASCSQTTYQTGNGYVVSVASASTQNFRISAARKFYSYAATDRLEMTGTITNPRIMNPSAIGFSLFKWLFD
jgi:type IV pilus assembly protein PilE